MCEILPICVILKFSDHKFQPFADMKQSFYLTIFHYKNSKITFSARNDPERQPLYDDVLAVLPIFSKRHHLFIVCLSVGNFLFDQSGPHRFCL